MTDLGLTNALNANSNVENEHLSGSAGAMQDGGLHASEDGATYGGSAGADAAYDSEHASGSAGADATASADTATGGVDVDRGVDGLPALPVDTPELPDLPEAGDLPATPDVEGAIEGALSATGDVGVSEDGASVDAGLDGWLDAMGDLMAQFAASVSAMLGL